MKLPIKYEFKKSLLINAWNAVDNLMKNITKARGHRNKFQGPEMKQRITILWMIALALTNHASACGGWWYTLWKPPPPFYPWSSPPFSHSPSSTVPAIQFPTHKLTNELIKDFPVFSISTLNWISRLLPKIK